MDQKEHKLEERHYQMAEKSDRMFRDDTQGYEIDI